MKSSTLRWVLLSCSLIIALILLAQLYWLKHVYTLEEQQFNTSVVKSIRGVCNDLELSAALPLKVNELVELVDANTYLIKLDSVPVKDSLQHFLTSEFEDFDVWTDCNVAVYLAAKNNYAYQFYINSAASRYLEPVKTSLSILKRNHDYLLLYFPHRGKYIMQEMLFWIVTAAVLLLVLLGLSVSLFFLYRQKFLNELQKDFVNNFTHEFKTPLAVMKIAGDVLMQPGIINKPDRFAKYSAVIREQTDHLQQQVERLLKTAVSENKKLEVNKEPCELNLLLKSTIEQLEPLTSSKGGRVDLIEDENEPVIFADRVHLQLVMINLIENGLKYSDGLPHIIVQLQDTANGMYSISVKDNGIGIERKNMRFLFNKFYRVPTGNIHLVNGFGLGLNFVKKIIDAHSGKIIINSVPAIGTEFKILLPKK